MFKNSKRTHASGFMLDRLRARQEWQFLKVLPKANRVLATLWWVVLLVRGVLPALFAIAMGLLVGAVQGDAQLAPPLVLVGVVFVLQQTLAPLHQTVGANLGSSTAAWLYDELTVACVEPPGMAHLEDPELTNDITMARDFDLGISGPPLSISMDFIAGGLVELLAGLASAAVLAAYAWWAPLLLGGAWLSTHWLLRESGVWKDRNTAEVREAQRHADYAYRLAVDAPASKELRLFGLAGLDHRPVPPPSPSLARPTLAGDQTARATGRGKSRHRDRCQRVGILVHGGGCQLGRACRWTAW